MKWTRLFCLGIVTCFGVIVLAFVLHLPVPGRFTEVECNRVRVGMSLKEVEALFGPAIPDDQSILVPRSRDRPTFWKAWGDRVSEIHVEFDQDEKVRGWVLQPRRPLVIHHILHR